jgi:GcrA cell cycle regulator
MARWEKESDDKLREMWAAGYAAREIAEFFGGITRCAVIGRAHRLALPARKKGPPLRPRSPRKPRSKIKPLVRQYQRNIVRFAAVAAIDLAPEVSPVEQTVLTLQKGQCRWPIRGEKDATVFCGRPTLTNEYREHSYCEHHCSKAYRDEGRADDARRIGTTADIARPAEAGGAGEAHGKVGAGNGPCQRGPLDSVGELLD